MEQYTKNEWNHFRDAIYDASGKDLNREELEWFYETIPYYLKCIALEWGMNDAEFKDGLIKWYKQKN